MHIPDNYLSPSTCAVMGAAMAPIWIRAAKKVKKELTKKKMPIMGIGAAFSFMVMMFNIPLPGGTTGHAVGAALVALLIGPDAACISVSIALLIQALLFGDGGILAFGANSFNMAFLMPYSGYYIYKFLKERIKSEKGEYVAIFISSYISINIAAFFAAVEFGIQPLLFRDVQGLPLYCPYPLSVSIPSMMIPHIAVVGILEGIITSGVYAFIKKVSPGIIYEGAQIKLNPMYLLIFALIILSPLGLLASGTAWGEWGADEIKDVISGGKALGFIPKGMTNGVNFNAYLPDYSIKGMPDFLGYILSAVAGVSILLIFFKLIADGKSKNKNV